VSGVAQISDKLRLTFGWAFSFACSNARDTCCELKESKMRSDPVLRKWYKTINKKFFDNYLPANTCVRWSNEDDRDEDERCDDKYNGWATVIDDEYKPRFLIVISNTLKKSMCTKLHTLLHEMCHLGTGLKDAHGPAFSSWHEHLVVKGAFKKGSVVKNLTLF
jgi:hypothetical protein